MALIELRAAGRLKSIGVSNFLPEHLDRLIADTGVTPAVNQLELHPHFQQRAVREMHDKLGIAIQCYSPLGRGAVLSDPAIAAIADAHGKSPAQIIIRWHLQQGLIVLPKTGTASSRRRECRGVRFRTHTGRHGGDRRTRPDRRQGSPRPAAHEQFVLAVLAKKLPRPGQQFLYGLSVRAT